MNANLFRTLFVSALAVSFITGCGHKEDSTFMAADANILFLHHSTGRNIWNGGVPEWIAQYNDAHGVDYRISERAFPKSFPYGWNNFPYDYWNVWVNHAGSDAYIAPVRGVKGAMKSAKQILTGAERGEPTLEMLTPVYDVIVMKHCFPGAAIEADTGSPDISSPAKRLENYRLQYEALKRKMGEFPGTKFIVWTAAALVRGATTPEEAERAVEFVQWVRDEWDEPGDNIFLWDFNRLETEGGLYLKDAYAAGATDSHPNARFSAQAAPLFSRRIVDVIEGRGDSALVTGASE